LGALLWGYLAGATPQILGQNQPKARVPLLPKCQFSAFVVHLNQSFLNKTRKILHNHPFGALLMENITDVKTNWRKLMTMNPAPNQNQNQNTLSIIAIVLGALSLVTFILNFILGFLFGIAAIILAILAKKKPEKLSTVALIIAIAATALGALFFIIFILAIQFLN
jgi:hypothetical protein